MTTFLYDGDGGRVKKTANGVATLYIGKLFECVLPCTPDGTATQYVFAGGERIASRITGGAPPPNPESDALVLDAVALSTTLYYHGDHLGSSSVITDADGRPQQRLAYMPYGATQANSGTLDVRHKYTGQELDAEIGLYFYNARYYDPVLGRFTQADTIVPNPANPQTLNRYSYALNNPMRYTDPTGHLSEGDLGPGLQFDPAYYASTPDPSSSFLSTDFTSANPYSLDLSVPDLTIDTSFAPLPTASDITASSTGESNGEGATAQFVGRTVIGEITGGITAETAAIAFMANDRLHRQASNRATLRYNKPPPRTIPPSGQTLDALQCFADCTGANSLLVTGGAEQSGHTPGSLHYQGLAVDVAPMPYNNLPPPNEVMSCAMPCGFTHGQFETFTNPARNHWHFQIGPGLGVPPLP